MGKSKTPQSESQGESLSQKLEDKMKARLKWSRIDFWISTVLLVLATLGSIAAAILPYVGVPNLVISIAAVIPAVAIFAESGFKCGEHSRWNHAFHGGLDALRMQLDYQGADQNTVVNSLVAFETKMAAIEPLPSLKFNASYGITLTPVSQPPTNRAGC